MEVILKRTKITSSILKQALRSTKIDLNNGEILGWCVFGKYGKYIVCYRSDIKSISIYPMFKEIVVTPQFKDSEENKTYLVEVKLEGNYTPYQYNWLDENDKNTFVELLNTCKHAAQIRGQIFI